MHGYGVAEWIHESSQDVLRVEEGALYPALHRLELRGLLSAEWGTSDNNRRAKFYSLTAPGRKKLSQETEYWRRMMSGGGLRGCCRRRRGARQSLCSGCFRVRDERFAIGVSDMATGRLDKFWRRLRATLRPGQVERELDEELEFHLAARAEKNRAMGMDAEQARLAARRQLGNATRVKEEARGVRVSTALEAVWRDFTYGLRTLRKRPGFTLVAVATLGLGIGASTAIFSVVENILVEPFPYPHAERFMTVEIHDVNRSGYAQGQARSIRRWNIWTTSRRIMFSICRSRTRRKMCCIPRAREWSGFTACW